jgi:hypothetical protein
MLLTQDIRQVMKTEAFVRQKKYLICMLNSERRMDHAVPPPSPDVSYHRRCYINDLSDQAVEALQDDPEVGQRFHPSRRILSLTFEAGSLNRYFPFILMSPVMKNPEGVENGTPNMAHSNNPGPTKFTWIAAARLRIRARGLTGIEIDNLPAPCLLKREAGERRTCMDRARPAFSAMSTLVLRRTEIWKDIEPKRIKELIGKELHLEIALYISY